MEKGFAVVGLTGDDLKDFEPVDFSAIRRVIEEMDQGKSDLCQQLSGRLEIHKHNDFRALSALNRILKGLDVHKVSNCGCCYASPNADCPRFVLSRFVSSGGEEVLARYLRNPELSSDLQSEAVRMAQILADQLGEAFYKAIESKSEEECSLYQFFEYLPEKHRSILNSTHTTKEIVKEGLMTFYLTAMVPVSVPKHLKTLERLFEAMFSDEIEIGIMNQSILRWWVFKPLFDFALQIEDNFMKKRYFSDLYALLATKRENVVGFVMNLSWKSLLLCAMEDSKRVMDKEIAILEISICAELLVYHIVTCPTKSFKGSITQLLSNVCSVSEREGVKALVMTAIALLKGSSRLKRAWAEDFVEDCGWHNMLLVFRSVIKMVIQSDFNGSRRKSVIRRSSGILDSDKVKPMIDEEGKSVDLEIVEDCRDLLETAFKEEFSNLENPTLMGNCLSEEAMKLLHQLRSKRDFFEYMSFYCRQMNWVADHPNITMDASTQVDLREAMHKMTLLLLEFHEKGRRMSASIGQLFFPRTRTENQLRSQFKSVFPATAL